MARDMLRPILGCNEKNVSYMTPVRGPRDGSAQRVRMQSREIIMRQMTVRSRGRWGGRLGWGGGGFLTVYE